MQPLGFFSVQPDATKSTHYILFAGGSGITPIISILQTVLREEPQSSVTLVYANYSEETIIFLQRLSDLQSQYAERLTVAHVLEEQSDSINEVFTGRLNPDIVAQLSKQYDNSAKAEYFICGPSGMMEQVRNGLQKQNIPDNQVHQEFFTTTQKETDMDTTTATPAVEELNENGMVTIKATLYGDECTIEMGADETVLEALIENDFDPPYACQIGACCACRAKLVSGKVEMDEREALSDEEIEDGYILTCQSRPKTAEIVVDYDQ
jgi:ring-1,2-phenylacetyl-CoA epoxidase subunit PaaE